MLEVLRSGRSIMWAAVAWNVFDALLHVAIDEIDVLRLAGNVVVLLATALTYAVKPGIPRAIVAAGAAAIVAALNLAFFIERGAVPIAALVLVAVSLVLLGLAAWRFRTEEREAGTTDSGSRA